MTEAELIQSYSLSLDSLACILQDEHTPSVHLQAISSVVPGAKGVSSGKEWSTISFD